MGALVIPDFFRAGRSFLLLSEQHIKFFLGKRAGGLVDIFDEVGDVVAFGDHLVGGIVVSPV